MSLKEQANYSSISLKYRAQIETKDISIILNKHVNEKDGEQIAKNTGVDFNIDINGVRMTNNDFDEMKLYNNKMYPSIEITFYNSNSSLITAKYPADNTIISFYKKSTSKGLMDIKMDFKMMTFKIIEGNKDTVKLKMTGVLNIDELYLYKYESYSDTSFNVLKNITKSMQLGFATNVTATNDKMTWINYALLRQDFIRDIIKKSYIDDNTFLFGYIDFYYNFNFVDINKQLNLDISQQKTIEDLDLIGNVNNDSENQKPQPLVLTNNINKRTSTLYIAKYTIIQDSTNININLGYRHSILTYNSTENKLSRYNIDALNNEDKNSIILKGNPYDKDILYEESIKYEYYGKIDEDNVHKNYLHAEIQNDYNLKYLQKLKIVVVLSKPNYSLYRFQKIVVELFDYALKKENTEESDVSGNYINRLCGDWLIMGINYVYNDVITQEITLVKRDLTKEYKKNK